MKAKIHSSTTMRKLVLSLMTAGLVVGCSMKEAKQDPAWSLSSDRQKYVPPKEEVQPAAFELPSVFFDTDRAHLTREGRKAIEKNAVWLKENPGIHIQIEGQCDERGTENYNVGLGARRAQAVLEYLASLGISRERMSTISFGKIPGATEKEMARNRRGSFLLIYPK